MLWRPPKSERHLVVDRHIPKLVPDVFGTRGVPIPHRSAMVAHESGMNLLTRAAIKIASFSGIVESTLVTVRTYLRLLYSSTFITDICRLGGLTN